MPNSTETNNNSARVGLNLDSTTAQVPKGSLTYALNATVEGFDGNQITYQNEQGNQLCCNITPGYSIMGKHSIIERNLIVLWSTNSLTGGSEIGTVDTTTCVYTTVINQDCLNLSLEYPILKAVHRITDCGIEVYWTDNNNPRRWIDLLNLPYAGNITDCNIVTSGPIDCNRLSVQPNFDIPQITYQQVSSEGTIIAGTYQFAVQYANAMGDGYTSYYSVTDPLSINNPLFVGLQFNYQTGNAIQLQITNIDVSGVFDYINIAAIKTINNITSVDLVGTYEIVNNTQTIIYTGQSEAGISLTPDDVLEKFLIFNQAGDVTTAQDILIWDNVTINEEISYQLIANQIQLQWESYVIPYTSGQYTDPLNTADYRGYMRDEVYPFEICFLYQNGYQSDGFHIPGRASVASDLVLVDNGDVITNNNVCDTQVEALPRWQVYNTAMVQGQDAVLCANENSPGCQGNCYQGPYQYGSFAYWQSTELYPCQEAIWGDLAGKPIRHFKFPDATVSPAFDNNGNIFPLSVKIDVGAVWDLINASTLTAEQKAQIAGFKILRGDRANNKSVIAKGILYNVGQYSKDGDNYFYPNYPFNDLNIDPFINNGAPVSTDTTLYSTSGQVLSTGGGLYTGGQFFNTVTNLGTAMYSYTLPANSLVNPGDQITINLTGSFGLTNTTGKSIFITWNGNRISGTLPDVTGSSAVNATDWNQQLILTVVSATQIDINGTLTYNTYQYVNGQAQYLTAVSTETDAITNADLTIPNVINVYGYSAIVNGNPNEPIIGGVIGNSETITLLSVPTAASLAQAAGSPLNGFSTAASKQRFTFHSPDTSFYQPALSTVLQLDSVLYGVANSHFVQVKDHAKYKFPSLDSYLTSAAVGIVVGFASGLYGQSDEPFSGVAAFTTITFLNDIIYRLIPRKNFAYQYDAVGDYNNSYIIPNDTGNKIRYTDIAEYIIPGVIGVGDINEVNNYQRESSVYLRTTTTLPFPQQVSNAIPTENSRKTLGQLNQCNTPTNIYSSDICSYYGALKEPNEDQYGQIYSYNTIDTGFQALLGDTGYYYVFGGDTFINKFALKKKLPFFLDNRVGQPDDSDIFYDEIGNIGYPTYWFSTDIQKGGGGKFSIGELFGVKVHNFDCNGDNFFYDSGKIYLFAYGIPYFFCESTVNVDYRQAYDNLAGDFYPHVSTGIPDDWLQEIRVSINNDNTYIYNKSFSKQNLENTFTHLPAEFIPNEACYYIFPNKAIYSDIQVDDPTKRINNWLIYRPDSQYDFPLTYGRLISLDGIENKAILARFESKAQLYNSLITINTSNPQAAYIGNSLLFAGSPPVDFGETDIGRIGTEHKFLLRTEFGQVTVDSVRGEIYLLNGQDAKDISDAGLDKFLSANLPFQMAIAFPNYPIDNIFAGVGLDGAYDNKYKRIVITKLDYKPNTGVTWNSSNNTFSYQGKIVELGDPAYFCNTSFTISYCFLTRSWTSFHTYLPNYYIQWPDIFYTGLNTNGSNGLWSHNTDITLYNNFYGVIAPYIIEYPFVYGATTSPLGISMNNARNDEILQSLQDYTKCIQQIDEQSFIETDNIYFDQAIIYNNQQNSGVLSLTAKQFGNLPQYMSYPMYNETSLGILYTKSDNFYNINTFWDSYTNKSLPSFLKSCSSLSYDKVINQAAMTYTNTLSFKKAPLRAKESKIRLTLNSRSDTRFVSQFIFQYTQPSVK